MSWVVAQQCLFCHSSSWQIKMRIHSSFHDYYDSMLSHGQDPKINYVRETTDFRIEKIGFPMPNHDFVKINNRNRSITCHFELIGFCGEIFPFIHLSINSDLDYDIDIKSRFGRIIYDLGTVKRIFGETPVPVRIQIWMKKESCVDYFREDIFAKYRVPVFHAQSEGFHAARITLNPCLKRHEFFRVFVPYQAWQKLSHYVGNVLTEQQKPILPVPDKIKAESHGFDKFSFRKDKETS